MASMRWSWPAIVAFLLGAVLATATCLVVARGPEPSDVERIREPAAPAATEPPRRAERRQPRRPPQETPAAPLDAGDSGVSEDETRSPPASPEEPVSAQVAVHEGVGRTIEQSAQPFFEA